MTLVRLETRCATLCSVDENPHKRMKRKDSVDFGTMKCNTERGSAIVVLTFRRRGSTQDRDLR